MPATASLPLSQNNKVGLERMGYAITAWYGFDDHWQPLYTHKDVSDKKRGDVITKVRFGSPKVINDAEASYLARKGSQGLFLWKPGEECLKHEFRNVTVTKDARGQRVVNRSEIFKGCDHCRAYEAALVKEKEEKARLLAETVAAARAPETAEALPEDAQCDGCLRTFTTHHGLMIHKKHCTAVVVETAPQTGSASAEVQT